MADLLFFDANGDPLKLTMWDVDRIMVIRGNEGVELSNIIEAQCTNKYQRNAISVTPMAGADEGTIEIVAPNTLLWRDAPLIVHLWQQMEGTEQRTLYTGEVPVIPRARPTNYKDAEFERQQNELERIANEEERKANELERIAAENARKAAETERVSRETARISAENARQTAENTRIANEDERETNEAQRIANELERIANEAERERLAAEMQEAAQGVEAATNAANAAAERAETAVSDLGDIAERTERAATSANSAAGRAETAATNAEAATVSANAATQAATTAAGSASAAAESANSAASAASTAATAANEAAAAATAASEAATQAAQAATEAAERAGTNADAAATAAQAANEAAERANAAAERTENALENFERSYATALLLNNSMPVAFRLFMEAMAGTDSITALTERFFGIAAEMTEDVYASTFYRYTTSSSPVGWKEQANAGLVCEPSTNETAGRDDYAGLPLFACFDCNYTIDAQSLEPVIHAIKDVCGEFSAAPDDSFVGVLQMTGWVRRTQTTTTKTLEYAAYRKEAGFMPLPEAVRISDNSVRPFVIHAKYVAGWNSQGRLSSVSGVMPAAYRPTAYGGINASHDTQIARWREWGNQYAGSSICDLAFLQTMLEIKYANLGSWNVMAGSRSYTAVYTAKVSESGVTRVLVTPEEAETYVVGSVVSIGSSADRMTSAAYDVCAFARITAISSVTIGGVEYGVVQTDAEAPFDVTADVTYILLQPWLTGTTDAVKGNDGSPFDNRSGKEPFKLQGVEVPCMYEVLADVVLNGNPGQGYTVWVNRRAEDIGNRSGTNPVNLGLLRKRNVTGTTTNNIAELNWLGTPENYMLVQLSVAGTTPITTGYCAPLTQTSINTGTTTWHSYRTISGGVNASLAAVFGNSSDTSTPVSWADTCRACGTAGNRGVYSE